MNGQSVKIGVDRAFIAEVTSDNESGVVYAASEAIPGVTEIAVTTNNAVGTFRADDGIYETYQQQGDVEVQISLAGLSQSVYAKVTGARYDATTGLSKDGKIDAPNAFALGFRTQKANGSYQYVWLLKGKFNKPDQTSTTKGDGDTAVADQYTFMAENRIFDGDWRNRFDSDDENAPIGLSDTLLNNATTGWFASPDYVPTAPGVAIADLSASTGTVVGTIDLTFSAPTDAASVKAQISDLNGWVDASTSAEITAASTAATITGLTAGNTYRARLVVVGGAKNGISNVESAAVFS